MSSNPLRNLLNKGKHTEGNGFDEWVIHYVHRGRPDDQWWCMGWQIEAISARGITLRDGTYLPYHRILSVVGGQDILWEKTT